VWSIDASVPLFGLKFIILFITCLVLFLILIPFNITLLFQFRRYLSQFRIVNHFKSLLDAFQASYKDNYCYWTSVHIIFRSIFFSLYALPMQLRLILVTIILVFISISYGYICPNKNKMVNLQELLLLTNLTIMHTVSFQHNEKIFSVITNVMISLSFVQFWIIVLYHFFTYTFHCDVAIKEKLMKFFTTKKRLICSYDVALLNIPERTYNYNNYQDGLVSDDFIIV